MKLEMTKRGKVTILGILLVFVVLLISVNVYKSHHNAVNPTVDLTGVPLQGVNAIADYHLIPIIDTQSSDKKQVYLNTEATPALFFATWSDQSQKDVSAIQDKLNKMGKGVHKPLVLVSTFVKTSDQDKASSEAKAFQEKGKVALPIAVQVGPPTEFVKQVPSLVYTDEKGTHVITGEEKILGQLNNILAIPPLNQANNN